MFSEKTILIFTGMLEQIDDKQRVYNIAKFISPELREKKIDNVRNLTEYFVNKHRLYDWINSILNNMGYNNLPGIRSFLLELEQNNVFYNYETKCIEIFDRNKKAKENWGLISDGDKIYSCVARLKLDKPDTDEKFIYNEFYNFIKPKALSFHGRIWNFNNGNITIGFYPGDKITNCIDCIIDILLNMCIFNSWISPADKNLNIRISCVTEYINFTKQTKNIYGPAVLMLNLLEDRLENNTIIIHENLYLQLSKQKQNAFQVIGKEGDEYIYNFFYEIGK
jgi:hypothetical protein